MTEETHDHLLQDIDGYVAILSKSIFPNFGGMDILDDAKGSVLNADPLVRVVTCLTPRKGNNLVSIGLVKT